MPFSLKSVYCELSLVNFIPHTKIIVKVYSTAEGNDEALKDIKVSLKSNSEQMDTLAKDFNQSLAIIEEKRQKDMQIRHPPTSELPPINENKSMATPYGGYTSRPSSAVPGYSSRPGSAVPGHSSRRENTGFAYSSRPATARSFKPNTR